MDTDTMQSFIKNSIKWVTPETSTIEVFNMIKKIKFIIFLSLIMVKPLG